MRSGSIAFAGGAGLAAALLTTLPANAALLTLLVTDNGALVGSATSSTGHLVFSTTSDSEFSAIDVTVSGVPLLPAPDLGTVTTDVSTSSGFTGTHTLGIFVKQSGFGTFQVNPGTVTFTANGLIGAPGPTTESFLLNSATVASVTFPAVAGDNSASAATPAGLLLSETEGIAATFTAPQQDQEATVEYAATGTVIPEPSTWVMMTIGFAGLCFAGYRKARGGAAFAA
jgi:hypothetical protein